MNRLDGKVAIITGAGAGMGVTHVRRFLEEGARVVFTDLADGPSDELSAVAGASGHYLQADATRHDDWARVVVATQARFGRVDILINNAGMSIRNTIEDTSEAEYRRIFEVNQLSVFLGIQAVIPAMREAGGGAIVNISSISGMVGRVKSMAYTATKFAVRGMTKVASTELGPERIRVNSVHPGPIETQMLGVLNADELDALAARIPLGRIGKSRDVSDLVLFLASDEAAYITGAEIVIDGGVLAA